MNYKFLPKINVSSNIHVSSSSTAFLCDSRELQINEALPTCSSRVPRTDIGGLQIEEALPTCSSRVPRTDIGGLQIEEAMPTSSSRLHAVSLELTRLRFLNIAKFLLALTILFSIPLLSQEATSSQYSHIKQLIISKQLNKAREEIKLAMAGNENDPTLNLYQTELWIAEGDSYYSSGQYKRALEIYEKAIEQYPSNPMVKMKYQEMVNKMKGVNSDSKESKPNESLPLQSLGLQGWLAENSDSPQNSPSVNLTISRTDFLLSIVCLQNFVLLLFLFLRLPRKS